MSGRERFTLERPTLVWPGKPDARAVLAAAQPSGHGPLEQVPPGHVPTGQVPVGQATLGQEPFESEPSEPKPLGPEPLGPKAFFTDVYGPAYSSASFSTSFPASSLDDSEKTQRPVPEGLLFHGDNALLLNELRRGPLADAVGAAGGLRLVYIDPPFSVGADFTAPLRLNEAEQPHSSPPEELIAYSDVWEAGLSGFLTMLYERLVLVREVLHPAGSLFLHCDWRTAPHLRLVLDEIFGPERFLGDIVWHYTGGGRAKRWFSRKHDRILHYAASNAWTFHADAVRVPYKPKSGYAKSGITSKAGKRYLPHPDGTPADDVWDIPMINPLSGERVGYPTQKPEALLQRIIAAASNPGDLVADFFCGSGSFAVAAHKAGRKWLVADASPLAVHTTKKRLLAEAHSAPFQLIHASAPQQQDESTPESTTACAVSCARQPNHSRAEKCHSTQKRILSPAAPFRHVARLKGKSIHYTAQGPRVSIHADSHGTSFTLEEVLFSPARPPKATTKAAILTAKAEAEAARKAAQALFAGREWHSLLDFWSVSLIQGTLQGPSAHVDPFAHVGPAGPAGPLAHVDHVIWHAAREKNGALALSTPVFAHSLVANPAFGGSVFCAPASHAPALALPQHAAYRGGGQYITIALVDIFANECRFSFAL